MAKDFSSMEQDNPVMEILGKAKAAAEKANEIEKQTQQTVATTVTTQTATVEIEAVKSDEPVLTEEEKRVLLNILIRESTKKEWKLFFTQHDLNMTQGIEVAVGFLMNEVNKGNLKLTKGGITR